MQRTEIEKILTRPASQELLDRRLGRLAYVAKDGTPRVIPIGFVWKGSSVVMCTTPIAAKVAALRRRPDVALTIDTEEFPPLVLLIRGRAELEEVDGIPEEYIQASRTENMTAEQRTEWEQGVRSLYDCMVKIIVTPTWVKLIDFDWMLPSAVEELTRKRDERSRA